MSRDDPDNSSPAHGPQALTQHLHQGQGRLAHLIAQSRRMEQLDRLFNAYLPPSLHGHARLIAANPQEWTVQTDNAAWATRLRYALPEAAERLAQHLKTTIPPLKIRIVPAPANPAPPPTRTAQASPSSVDVIESAARSTTNPELSAALQRLARHMRDRCQTIVNKD